MFVDWLWLPAAVLRYGALLLKYPHSRATPGTNLVIITVLVAIAVLLEGFAYAEGSSDARRVLWIAVFYFGGVVAVVIHAWILRRRESAGSG